MAGLVTLFVTLVVLLSCVDATPHHYRNFFPGARQRFRNEYGFGGRVTRERAFESSRNVPTSNGEARAIYFMSNDQENTIVALPVTGEGLLAEGTFTSTGGSGANGIDGETMEPAVPDALFSQGAITIAGDFIFAVNAGSNTLSMLAIDRDDPTMLTLVGEPVDTLGEFPLSVGASMKHGIACVGNSGAVAGVACARFSDQGLEQMDDLRVFDINQSTPPVGPTNTVSHCFFSGDEDMLFTTVKGDPEVDNVGFIAAYPVLDGAVSMEDTRSSPDGNLVLFGSAPVPNTNNVIATDAAFGLSILSVDGEGNAESVARLEIDDQMATCWVTISEVTGTAFVTDVARNRLVEVDVETAEIIKDVTSDNGNPGLIDLRAAGGRVFVLSPGNDEVDGAITVYDISGGAGSFEEIQNFRPSFGVSGNSMGMAVRM